MKYSIEMVVKVPRSRVLELFDDRESLFEWQEGLVSFEPVSGEPGQEGSTSKLHYKMGRREVDMIETITRRALPEEFSATYEADGVWNLIQNHFREESPDETHWTLTSEFKCSGLLMKLMTFLMPGAFKKQTRKFMNDFKTFAEKAA